MQELRVTLETVTPLFLGGAEPRGDPELRPPALRGALRYWLRAALGGAIGDGDIKKLSELESSVFGSTEFGSPIQVRLRPLGSQLETKSYPILPHKEKGKTGSRKAISPGQRFEATLLRVRKQDAADAVWEAACAALRLTVTLGGLGLRSRRGYGTLCVIESSDITRVPVSPVDLGKWQGYVKDTVKNGAEAARRLAKSRDAHLQANIPSEPTSYPCVNTKGLLMICHEKNGKPVEASSMGAVRQFMQVVPARESFGSVIPRRQASPLWVRPIAINGGFGLLFTVLASRFKNHNEEEIKKFLDLNFPGEYLRVKGWNQ